MNLDLLLAVAAFGIGIVVGLTGTGGGALMTPMLVLFFDVLPLTAVSSDTGLILLLVAIFAPVLWMFVRRLHGFPAIASRGGAYK